MNSGADGQETSQTLTSAEVMHADGSVETWRWDQAAGVVVPLPLLFTPTLLFSFPLNVITSQLWLF
jgi:hypothetical protein